MSIQLSIVVPCYNEEEVLPETSQRLLKLLTNLQKTHLITEKSSIYFIDDGSSDRTWDLIEALVKENSFFRGIKLSRNQGHQNAVLAGMFHAQGDAIITIDADLQDDTSVIKEMVQQFIKGNEIVYGVRESRKSDTIFKRITAKIYYRLLRCLGVNIIENHADFRLMGKRAVDALRQFPETNLFLRGIVPMIGFQSTCVFYDRTARFAGESKYPLGKMLALALNGITSFSMVPLRMVTILGFVVFLLSLLMIGWVIYGYLILHATIPGWASSVLPIYFLGGIQLLSLGILGEYLAKIYLETKCRPRFFIDKEIGFDRAINKK